jgi:hypothetical protein
MVLAEKLVSRSTPFFRCRFATRLNKEASKTSYAFTKQKHGAAEWGRREGVKKRGREILHRTKITGYS